MCIRHHTQCSVESVVERGVVSPSLSSVGGRVHQVVETRTSHASVQAQYIIYNTKKWGCLKSRVVQRKPTLLNVPCVFLIPAPPRPEKPSTTYPKKTPHQISHHQCADPVWIDPIGSPHPWIQCRWPLQRIHTQNPQSNVCWLHQEHTSQALSITRTQRPWCHPESDLRHQRIYTIRRDKKLDSERNTRKGKDSYLFHARKLPRTWRCLQTVLKSVESMSYWLWLLSMNHLQQNR